MWGGVAMGPGEGEIEVGGGFKGRVIKGRIIAIISTIAALLRILAAGCECADAFRSLLELIHQILLKPTAEKKAMLPAMSNDVTSHVGKVISAVSVIRGTMRRHFCHLHAWGEGD